MPVSRDSRELEWTFLDIDITRVAQWGLDSSVIKHWTILQSILLLRSPSTLKGYFFNESLNSIIAIHEMKGNNSSQSVLKQSSVPVRRNSRLHYSDPEESFMNILNHSCHDIDPRKKIVPVKLKTIGRSSANNPARDTSLKRIAVDGGSRSAGGASFF